MKLTDLLEKIKHLDERVCDETKKCEENGKYCHKHKGIFLYSSIRNLIHDVHCWINKCPYSKYRILYEKCERCQKRETNTE
jgi:hypothetical protein